MPAPALTDERPASARRLPLPEVRDIIEQHQGMIIVSPEPGRGTAFDIYLPAAVPRDLEEALETFDFEAFKEGLAPKSSSQPGKLDSPKTPNKA